jgi:signal transduction histidine kinase
MAGEVLAEAKRQIRDVILNLRSDVLMRESAEALVAKVANELNARGIVRARVRLRGIPSDLTAGEKSDLVAIVQQAVTNAVNHGRAKNVAIVSDPAERTGTQACPDPSRGKAGFVLRILNDGEPFDAGKALGPESGHFGLSNMRERAKRSGMAIEWCREGKWMCVKVEKFNGSRV